VETFQLVVKKKTTNKNKQTKNPPPNPNNNPQLSLQAYFFQVFITRPYWSSPVFLFLPSNTAKD